MRSLGASIILCVMCHPVHLAHCSATVSSTRRFLSGSLIGTTFTTTSSLAADLWAENAITKELGIKGTEEVDRKEAVGQDRFDVADTDKFVSEAIDTETEKTEARNLAIFKMKESKFDWRQGRHRGSSRFFTRQESQGKSRPAVFVLYSTVAQTVLEELAKKGEDWVVGYPGPARLNDASVVAFVRWIRKPANAKRYGIDPKRIALLGYSKGGIAGGNAAKRLGRASGVRGMIFLNSGVRTMKSSVKPLPSYLIITGMKQKAGWLTGNAKIFKELKAMGTFVKQLKLPDVDHVNWRKEKKLVFSTITAFLINRVAN